MRRSRTSSAAWTTTRAQRSTPTLAEQLEGDTIDDRNRREQPQRERADTSIDLVSRDGDDGIDREKDLVADVDETEGPLASELSAMHVVDEAPGVVDHPDDYIER